MGSLGSSVQSFDRTQHLSIRGDVLDLLSWLQGDQKDERAPTRRDVRVGRLSRVSCNCYPLSLDVFMYLPCVRGLLEFRPLQLFRLETMHHFDGSIIDIVRSERLSAAICRDGREHSFAKMVLRSFI